MTVFLSYAREDRRYAQKLAKHLARNRVDVWWDHQLVVGARYEEETEAKLDAASAVIVLVTPESVSSHWVRDEVKFAIDEGKSVYPLLLRACKIPLRWRSLQHEDVTGRGMPSNEFVSRLAASSTHSLRDEIEKLRMFEREYRSRLKSYYTEQVQALIAFDGTPEDLAQLIEKHLGRIDNYFVQRTDALDSPTIDALVRATFTDREDMQDRSFLKEYRYRLQQFFSAELEQVSEDRGILVAQGTGTAASREQLAAYFNDKLVALGMPPVVLPWE